MINKIINWISIQLLKQKKEHFATHFLIVFFFILPLMVIASFSIINSYKSLTNFTLERRDTIASLAGSTILERLDGIVNVGNSLSAKVPFLKLIEAGEWEEAIKQLEMAPKDFSFIERVSLFDKQGIFRSATNPTTEITGMYGKDFSHRDYYQGVSKNWEPYVGEVIKPAIHLDYNLAPVAIPIKAESDKILGFLLLSIKLDTIAAWAKNIDLGSESFLYIVDQKGHLVVHPTLLPAEDVIDFSSVPTVQKLLKGERGVEVIFNPIEKEERLTAYESVSKYGWGVVLVQPTKIAFTERNREIMKLSILYALILLFGFVLSVLFLKLLHSINDYRQKEKILLDSIGDGVVAIDRFWNITLWNKAAEKITGWTKEEVMGKPLRNFLKLLRERDRTENIVFIEEALIYGQVGFLENNTALIAKDGKEIPVGDSAAPVFDPTGLIIGAIVIFRDISTEKESHSLKSDFAYASHQLNTPATKVLWNLESALEENDNQKLKEKLKIAYQSAKSIQKLNMQLFTVSEIDQKIIIPVHENVKLVDFIGEILKESQEKIKERNVSINIEPISPVLGFNTDTKILKRILMEILENGLNYSKSGGMVKLKTATQNDSFLFEISDTGIGIPEDQQALVFTKFFRGNNFNTTDISGAGLGLFISREYVRLLGGKIWFESKEGKGVTFFISLPLK